jgi:hypothetical protein
MAALATAGLAAGLVAAVAVSANAAQAPNGQWHHDDVRVRSFSSNVKCISMTWPGAAQDFSGMTITADTTPGSEYSSLGSGAFHYSGDARNIYRFKAYDQPGCTGNVVNQSDLSEPEDSLTYWWVTL